MGMVISRPGNGYDGTTCLLQRAAGARTPWYLNHRVYPPGARAKEPTFCSRCPKAVLVGTGLQTGAVTNFLARGKKDQRGLIWAPARVKVLNRAGRGGPPRTKEP